MKPTCPEHPKATVLQARVPGTLGSRWVCLECGKNLGDAGFKAPPEWEEMTIGPGDAGSVPKK